MKRNLIFFVIALVVAFLFSCKKEKTSTSVPSAKSRIKTWTGNSGTTTYSYDALGRCTQELYADGSKTTYEYENGKVTEKHFTGAGVNNSGYVYELNNEGVSSKQTAMSFPYEETRIYNSNQQVLKSISTVNGSSQAIDFFYSNGNCDSSRFTNGNGQWTLTVVRTYYTDKFNSMDNDAFGMSFFGKDSKNLLKTEQYCYSNGTKGEMTTYTYEFDSKGRAIKETRTQGSNIGISYLTYY